MTLSMQTFLKLTVWLSVVKKNHLLINISGVANINRLQWLLFMRSTINQWYKILHTHNNIENNHICQLYYLNSYHYTYYFVINLVYFLYSIVVVYFYIIVQSLFFYYLSFDILGTINTMEIGCKVEIHF